MSEEPDRRGSQEINRLADRVIEHLKKNAADPVWPFIRDVFIVPALVDAYAKGVEIGAEYERKKIQKTNAE